MKMTCENIQAHLRAGGELDPALEAHLDACLECTEVAAEVGGLGSDDGVGLPDLDAVLGSVERSLSEERGVRAWLADRSTRTRMLLAGAFCFGLPLIYGIVRLRADIFVYPTAHFAVIFVALVAILGLIVRAGLRPLHRPTLSSGVSSALLGAAVGVVVISSAMPAAHALHPESLMGVGDDFLTRAAACFALGLAIGIPVAFAVRLLSRARASWLGAPMMAPLAGVIAANLALHLHCPLVAPEHLLAGHATVLVPFALAIGVLVVHWHRCRVREHSGVTAAHLRRR
jgi:hypothetical protein